MNRRMICMLVASAAAIFALAGGASQAFAYAPSPVDGAASESASPANALIYLTQPFALGEVDLSTLGVSDAELLTVGPVDDSTAPSTADSKLIVDSPDDGIQCPNAQYTMIQPAVLDAQPGDTIKVCSGIYIEQVTIPVGKDGLKLVSEPKFKAVIQAPPVMVPPQAIVRVNGAQDVRITEFTITGPGGTGCNSIRYGVFVDAGGSAHIDHNHITEIHDTPFSGCQNGLGVALGRTLPPDGPTTGSGHVDHNLIDNYQKGGVLVDNAGSSGEVDHNEIVGIGATPIIAQNGIQASRGASAHVDHNKVSMNNYALPGTDSTGILLFMETDSGTVVDHNKTFLNDAGIYLFSSTTFTEVDHNSSTENDNDGIIVGDDTSRDNTIDHNKALDNGVLDCEDDSQGTGTAGTANFWIHDQGFTEFPAGICKH